MHNQHLGRIGGAVCAAEQRISAAPPTPKPIPSLAAHVGHLLACQGGSFEAVRRIEIALDRLIGMEPEKVGSDAACVESPSCLERDLHYIGESASTLVARLHRIAQRLDSAV